MNNRTKVAVIGLGNIGKGLIANLIKGGHPVIISSRDNQKAVSYAESLGKLVTAKETALAIEEADVIIPAIYFEKIEDFVKEYASVLAGKVIVDVSNPIAPNGEGGFKKIIGADQSAGQILSALIPKDAHLVKAFGTLGAASLTEEAFAEPERKVLFYASDHTNSNRQIEELITAAGFNPLHIGGINQSIHIEVFGELHQFGALGRTVTLEEAKQALKNSPVL
ncbi:MAG: NAD(P)-binding domain-containing protein [Sphingobacteriaceae bacterium]|nr:NAD(P)-binding domain-containing protein [Sphingobacteriaceae bacterium]